MISPITPAKTAHVRFRTDGDIDSVRSILEADAPLEVRVEKKRKTTPMLMHALSGVVGSLVAELLLFPVDRIKLIIQTSHGRTDGFLGILAQLVQETGVAGLYKGLGASLFKESVHSFNFWLWHGLLFRHFAKADDTSKTPAAARLLLNLAAKQLNWLCTTPFEVVATKNQLAADSPGFFHTAAILYNQGGLGVFYRGLAISMALAINPAIMNTLITSLLRIVAVFRTRFQGMDYETARDHGPAVVGLATGISKFAATAGTYPLIRVKVLQQASDGAYAGVMQTCRSILAEEGVQGLYRGLLPMSYKTVVWNAVMMMFKQVLGPKRIVTPPRTPPRLDTAALVPPMPGMGRDTFPAELITSEKLDHVLSYLKSDSSGSKVQKLEGRIAHISQELGDVKHLLHELMSRLPPAGESLAGSRA